MSLVICVSIFNCGIYLVGDKRASTRCETGFKVFSDDVTKIFKINDFTAIGVTGSYEAGIALSKFPDNYNNLSKVPIVYPDEIARCMQGFLRYQSSDIVNRNIFLAVAGIDRFGIIRNFTIDGPSGFSLTDQSPSQDHPITFSYHGDGNDDTCSKFISDFQQIRGNVSDLSFNHKIVSCMQNHINYVSSFVPTINEKTDVIILKK